MNEHILYPIPVVIPIPLVLDGAWVDVDAQLPEAKFDVLGIYRDAGECYVTECYRHPDGRWLMPTGDRDIDIEIIAWMPKPAIPRRYQA